MPDVGGRQIPKLHRADEVSKRRYHLAAGADRFLRTVGETICEPVVNGLPNGVVRGGVESVVEFPAQLAQLVAHLGLGPAGNLAADSALAVCAPAEGDGTDVALLSPRRSRSSPRHARVERSYMERNAMAPRLAPRACARCG